MYISHSFSKPDSTYARFKSAPIGGYASNQEKSLRVACVQEFPIAVSYICVVHAKRNILEKCSELVSKTLSSEIIEDIFGLSAYVSLSLPGINIG